MLVYKIVNKINGKVYIGKTTKSLNHRMSRHIYHAKNRVNRKLYDAMNKYGYDNFEIFPLCECGSGEELNDKERAYIEEYKSMSSDFGYNMTSGGDGGPMPRESILKMISKKKGVKLSDETKKKMSDSKIGKKHGPMSDEQKIKLSESIREKWKNDRDYSHRSKENNHMRGKCGDLHPFYGKRHSEKAKEKIRISATGRVGSDKQKESAREKWLLDKNPRYKPIDNDILIEKVKLDISLYDIGIYFGVSYQGMLYKIKRDFGCKNFNDFRDYVKRGE